MTPEPLTEKRNHADDLSLPPGFKMTELGPLPEEWQVVRLGEVANLIMGQSPPSYTYNYDLEGLPFLQGKAEFGDIHPNPIKWCSRPIRTAKPNDILISVRAPVGDVNLADKEYCIGRGLACIRTNDNVLDPCFTYFQLVYSKAKLEERGTGSTFKSINKGILMEFPIPLPPLPEQKAIAHVLRTVQGAKEAVARVIQAARELKKSLMRHLFTYGPVPLDQVHRVPLRETDLGPLPAHWQVVRLGEVGTVITGRTPPTENKEYWNGSIPFITPVDLNGELITRSAQRTITQKGLRHARPLPKGAVLVSCIGYIGKVGITDADISVTNQQINAIVVDIEKAQNEFIAYAVMNLIPLMTLRARATTVPILSKKNFEEFPIPLPPLPEQQAIARILQAVDRKIAAEEARQQALEALFKTMLHHLMTGQVRVVPPTAEAAE